MTGHNHCNTVQVKTVKMLIHTLQTEGSQRGGHQSLHASRHVNSGKGLFQLIKCLKFQDFPSSLKSRWHATWPTAAQVSHSQSVRQTGLAAPLTPVTLPPPKTVLCPARLMAQVSRVTLGKSLS